MKKGTTELCPHNINDNKKFSLLIDINSVAQSRPTLYTTPGFPVHNQIPKLDQTHVHRVCDAMQPFHPALSLSPPALNLSQHQGLFK